MHIVKSHLIYTLCVILCVVSLTALRASENAEITVISDISNAGRLIQHPTVKNPTYYYPIIGGYKEMGSLVKNERRPNQKEIVHRLAVELAKQGYYVINKTTPPPSIILLLNWGYINPDIIDSGAPSDPHSSTPTQTFINQNEMLALVGGSTLRNLELNYEKEDVMQAAEQNRYFLSVLAYDYTIYAKSHKKVMLWHAKVSIPTAGVSLEEIMPALIKAGGSQFGIETTKPKIIKTPITREGKVEIGTPTVKDYNDSQLSK